MFSSDGYGTVEVGMASILKSLRLLGDSTRVRILLLLSREELSVAELQEVLGMGQSTISTLLAQLKQAELVEDRRTGKNSMYQMRAGRSALLMTVLSEAEAEIPESKADAAALQLVLVRRQDRVRAYFNSLAGKFGRQYVPGRSWQALAEALLRVLPPLVIADVGAGEGTISQWLAQRAERVIAIDNADKMVEYGAQLAQQHGLRNLEYRKGDLEALPLDTGSIDLALLSQSLHHATHPARAVAEAYRILKPGGQVLILDLRHHQFEEARELYADIWLGFTEGALHGFLTEAGFTAVETAVVHRESEAPHFEVLLAVGRKK